MAQATRSLPARPHLGYLKKLAKQHLAALRARVGQKRSWRRHSLPWRASMGLQAGER